MGSKYRRKTSDRDLPAGAKVPVPPLESNKQRAPNDSKALGIVLGLVVIIVLGVVSALVIPEAFNTPPRATGGLDRTGSTAVVNKAHYDRIREGMSYLEVIRIIGAEGVELSSNKIDGVPGVMPSISTKMYMWQNSNGSNMNAMFQNDRLVQKAQFGLE